MPTIFSGVENRIAQARITTAIGALNERQEALDAKVNAALALSVLAATISLIALKRR